MKFKLLFGFIIFILIALGALVLFMKLRNPLAQPEVTFDTSRTAVVKQIQELQRLETASFTIEKIIEGGTQEGNAFQDILFGDRILLIAHGNVIAGFDLSTVSEDDIQIEGKNLTITLPPPQVLITSLDNAKTRVYDRDQGYLSRGNKDLESEARQKAEETIQQAACEADILDQASDNGRKQLTALFSALGFTTVSINIPGGRC